MASEIRHKGPIKGQTVKYVTGGVIIPAMITSVSAADGTIGITYFPDQSAPAFTNGVKYDYTGALNNSWHWSEDL